MTKRPAAGDDAESLPTVTAAQETAIALMLQGKTIKDAASAAGVSRSTLFAWMRHDPVFVAAYNGWRREQHQAVRAQLLAMAGDAAAAVRDAVQRGDGRLALSLLKGLGMLASEAPGSEQPEAARRELELARRKEELERCKAEVEMVDDELLAGMGGRES